MREISKDINYRGTNVRYYVCGEGTPFILMHGWGCNSSTVKSVARTAQSCEYKVYNIDLPGFGASEEPAEIWGVEDYCRLIEYIVERENIKNPVIAGHSFGGRIAIIFSSRNKTNKVVLIDAAGIKPRRKLSYYLKVYKFKALKYMMKTFAGKDHFEKWAENYRKKYGSADYSAASPKMRRIMSKSVNQDLKKYLHSIKSPTLLLWGELDTATPLRDAKIMNKLIPDSGLVIMEGAGHYSFLDSPVKFNATLDYFLKH